MEVFNVTEAMCCSIWAVILSFSTVKERAFANNMADDNSMILISNDEMDKGSCESHWSVSPLLISNVLRFSDSIRISFHSLFVGRGSGVGLYYHMNHIATIIRNCSKWETKQLPPLLPSFHYPIHPSLIWRLWQQMTPSISNPFTNNSFCIRMTHQLVDAIRFDPPGHRRSRGTLS